MAVAVATDCSRAFIIFPTWMPQATAVCSKLPYTKTQSTWTVHKPGEWKEPSYIRFTKNIRSRFYVKSQEDPVLKETVDDGFCTLRGNTRILLTSAQNGDEW
jgi:hypothetical protein